MAEEPPVDAPDTDDDTSVDHIEPIEIQEEMEHSFLEYAMSVIVSRALPDARDGLNGGAEMTRWVSNADDAAAAAASCGSPPDRRASPFCG